MPSSSVTAGSSGLVRPAASEYDFVMRFWDSLRDANDVLRRARGAGEVLKAVFPGLAGPIVLNEGEAPIFESPSVLIAELRRVRHALKAHVVGGRVDYAALRETGAFAYLVRLAPGLRRVGPTDLVGDAERIAFFVNLYNVLSIHGVIALEISDSVMEIPSFFGRVSYLVGDVRLSLDAIENGVLRRNARHPVSGRLVLPRDSPAHAFAPSATDPRIHTALVCSSTSCPPVGFYDPARLDAQLDAASAWYVNADVRVVDGAVRLPVTFRYYAADWGGREGIERFLVRYADEPLRTELEAAFAAGAPFAFDRYDWSLNQAL